MSGSGIVVVKGRSEAGLKCPVCFKLGNKVIDTRHLYRGRIVRRRRRCTACAWRWTTYEIDESVATLTILAKHLRTKPLRNHKQEAELQLLKEQTKQALLTCQARGAVFVTSLDAWVACGATEADMLESLHMARELGVTVQVVPKLMP